LAVFSKKKSAIILLNSGDGDEGHIILCAGSGHDRHEKAKAVFK